MDEEFSGFSVAPSPNCLHIADSSFAVHQNLQPTRIGADGKAPRQNLFLEHQACSACGDAEETWVCLSCSYSGCSRYKQAHMVNHASKAAADDPHVCIAISLSDLSVWCFQCDEYIVHPKLDKPFREMHHGKFGFEPKISLHTESQGGATITIASEEESAERGDVK